MDGSRVGEVLEAGAGREAAVVPRIAFDGSPWRLFRIAAGNMVLTVLTVGVWRFWARARLRRYLWNAVSVDLDGSGMRERLEYTGTGSETASAFAIAAVSISFTLIVVETGQLLAGDLPLPGVPFLALIVLLWPLAAILAQRYRASRTLWGGIACGLEAPFWRYAAAMLLRMALLVGSLGLLAPWVALHEQRTTVGGLRFGTEPVRFEATWRDFRALWIPGVCLGLLVLGLVAVEFEWIVPPEPQTNPDTGRPVVSIRDPFTQLVLAVLVGGYVGAALLLGVTRGLLQRAAFRGARLGAMRFQWRHGLLRTIAFHAGNALLGWLSFGLLGPWARWREWGFVARGLEVEGAVDLRAVQASATTLRRGEGLAAAIGA